MIRYYLMITVNFLGDSITDAGGASDRANLGYVNVLANMFPLIPNKYAVGGSRVARVPGEENLVDFITRSYGMCVFTDFLFIMGGTNDFGHAMTPIGEIGVLDEHTFAGAFEILISTLIPKFGREKMCVIIPIPRKDENSLVITENVPSTTRLAFLDVYRDIIRKICAKYQVETLDLTEALKDVDKVTADGCHPNDLGHRIIATELMKYLHKKGLK